MLENPFKPITHEEDTDPKQNEKLVAAILGPDAAKKYAELDAGREGKKRDDISDLTLTDTEKNVVKEAREKEVWDRAHYIRWAESLGKDEEWVDETFTFYSDGTAGCGNLNLVHITELHEFPQYLIIHGYLDLLHLTFAKGLTLPTKIGGYLDLRNLTSVQDLVLPTEIGDNLYLTNLNSAQGLTLPTKIDRYLDLQSLTSAEGLIIPENFHVGYDVYTSRTLRPFFEKLKEEGNVGGDIIVLR